MAKDNLVHPYYNHAYARYDLDIEDIILGLKKAGYILDDDSNLDIDEDFNDLDGSLRLEILSTRGTRCNTTVNKISVTSGAKYRIDINPVSYVCICFYDSNGNFVDWMENNTSDWSVGSLSTTFTVGSNVKYLRVCGVSDGTRVTGALNEIS